MTYNPRYVDSYKRALDALLEDQSTDLEYRDLVDRAVAAMTRVIRACNNGNVETSADQGEPANHQIEGEKSEPDQEYYGDMSASEAAVAYLRSLAPKEAKQAAHITRHISKYGYPFSGSSPQSALTAALRLRAKNIRDVVQVGYGLWGLREWYTQKEITEFSNSARIKAGLEAAKKRGARFGKAPKITEEMWNLAIRLYVDEDRSMDFVHQKVSELFKDGEAPITRSSLYNRRKQFQAREPYPEKWKEYFESIDLPESGEKAALGKPKLRAVE